MNKQLHKKRFAQVRPAFLSIFSRLVGTFINFMMIWYVIRVFGISANGHLYIAISSILLFSFVFSAGFPRYFLRTFSIDSKVSEAIASFKSTLIIFHCGSLLGLAGAIVSFGFGSNDGAFTLLAGAAALGQAANQIHSDFFKGRGRPSLGLFLELNLAPLLTILALGILSLLATGEEWMPAVTYCLLAIGLPALVTILRFGSKFMPSWGELVALRRLISHDWHRHISGYWVAGLGIVAFGRVHGTVSPFALSLQSVGELGVVISISTVLATVGQAVNAAVSAEFARIASAQDSKKAVRLYVSASALYLGTSGAIGAILFTFRNDILGLLGIANPSAELAMGILVAAQLFRAATGCSEAFLLMSGRQKLESLSVSTSVAAFLGAVFVGLSMFEFNLVLYAALIAFMIILRSLLSLAMTIWTISQMGMSGKE